MNKIQINDEVLTAVNGGISETELNREKLISCLEDYLERWNQYRDDSIINQVQVKRCLSIVNSGSKDKYARAQFFSAFNKAGVQVSKNNAIRTVAENYFAQ